MPPRRTRVLLVFPGILALVVSVTYSFAPMLGLLLFALAALLIPLWAMGVLAWAVLALVRGAWRTTLVQMFFLLLAAPCTVLAVRSGDTIHLGIMYPWYVHRIHAHPDREIVVHWGSTGFAGSANSERALLYEPAQCSDVATGAHPLEGQPGVVVLTTHLLEHFYVRETSW